MNQKVGRNDPCPCGSGKKYKNCCSIKSKPASKRGFKASVIKTGNIPTPFPMIQPQPAEDPIERAFKGKIKKTEEGEK